MTKYDLIFKKIRELKYQHNLDNCVFRALFDFNMENVSDKKININDKEYFTYLSGSPESKTFASFEKFSDLLKYFKKDSFTKNTSLNDLFQEVHNRYMFEQGYDVKKIVQENTQTKGMNDTIAYVCHGTSELAINYSILNHAAVLPVTKSPAINRENVGLMFLNTV
ncbi:MAG: hypothetical protein IJW82_06585, partial [Clostridia bacterium]|nr:hypothetical protein [Clostridia bacterium]